MWQQSQDTGGLIYMTKIAEAFQNKKAFIGFLTAGDPSLACTEEFIVKMEEAGAALIEIGIPFSDPIAEGPAIQAANIRALSNPSGCTTDQVFEMVERVSRRVTVPLVFLTYLNPVFKYGYERFFARCQSAGISGIIIPDMPLEEKGEVAQIASSYDVDVISLIAPTSEARIAQIAKSASGYLYIVSSMGVTGMRSEITTDLESIIRVVRENTTVPAAIGFGINTPEQAEKYAAMADGVIVGSAIVKIIEKYGKDAAQPVYDYVKEMADAAKRAQ